MRSASYHFLFGGGSIERLHLRFKISAKCDLLAVVCSFCLQLLVRPAWWVFTRSYEPRLCIARDCGRLAGARSFEVVPLETPFRKYRAMRVASKISASPSPLASDRATTTSTIAEKNRLFTFRFRPFPVLCNV